MVSKNGIFVCSVHDFSTSTKLSPADQEDQWYGHLRQKEHEHIGHKACDNCSKHTGYKVKAKVPMPTPDNKNPRVPLAFCNEKCKKEYLKKVGL